MSVKTIEVEATTDSKVPQAENIVKANVFWAMGAGLVPVPFLDLAGIAGVQLKMLNELSSLYGIKFSEHRVKSILASLIGSIGTNAIATGAIGSLIKMIPIVGTTTGIVTIPIVAGASTYAVGKVFIMHFESGGTFLDFDANKMKSHFSEKYKEGQKLAADIKAASK
jgi:uncharacterized protein (DUF697 family)